MSLVWFDGFESYSNDAPATKNYRLSSTIGTLYGLDGRFSDSKSMSIGPSVTSATARRYLDAPVSAIAVGVSMRQNGGLVQPSAAQFNGISFAESNLTSANYLCVGVLANGSIQVWRGNSFGTNVLGTTDADIISSDVWHHIGVEVTRSASTGTVNVYVDGVQQLALTGVNTGSTNWDLVNLCKYNAECLVDDLYIVDAATWLGEARVSPLAVTADTAQADFTPSTGSDNYACVDDIPPNLTDYVSSSTVGNKDLYEIADLSYTPVNILGVKITSYASKDDITTRTARNIIKSGATSANGATNALSNTPRFVEDIWETDPNTGVAWIKSGVDALEIGVEVVA